MNRKGIKEVILSVSELVDLSDKKLSPKSIAANCSRANTSTNPTSWINEPDPNDGRKLLIRYSTIPQQTINKYNLPDVQALIDRIKADAYEDQQAIEQQEIEFREDTLKRCIKEASTVEYVKYCPQYSKLFNGLKEQAKKDKIILMAKTHAVLQCCVELKGGRGALGYKIGELHEAYLKTPGIKISLKNAEKFRQKLVEAEKSGLNIIHKCTGSPREHLVKLTQWHKAKIELYYKDPKQYTVKQVSEMVFAECLAAKQITVTESSIAKYLQKAEIKNRLSVYRNPSFFKRTVKPHTRRVDPDYAGDLYYADGSPIQVFCWNKQKTAQIRLNLFVVMDVKSKKIVGFDFSESEDRFNWFSAFKMAFNKEGVLPYQLMTDQGSVTKTAEYAALQKELEVRGCKLNTTKKGEGQQKSDIERWFNTFQGYQRMIDGFIGEGIRSKRENGRIDADFLKAVKKEKDLYTYESMVTIITELIGIYNQKTENTRRSPNQVFSECEKPNATKVTSADIAVLFWLHKTIRVKTSEVKFDIRKQTYIYDVFNHEIGLKINNTDVKVYYDEHDPSTVHLFTMQGAYICECRQKTLIKKALVSQSEADVMNIIKQGHHNDSMVNTAKKLTQNVINKGLQVDEGLLTTLDPFTVQKDLYNDAESKYNLDYIYNEKGIDNRQVATYQPVDSNKLIKSKLTKQTVQERHAKKNIVPATLEVLIRP